MTNKELQEFLKQHPEDATVFFSLWTASGEKQYHLNRPMGEVLESSPEGVNLRISWTDDCPADRLK